MNDKIIAKNKEHLKELIQAEIDVHGYSCGLNHIDVSEITDMSYLFLSSNFNGNISQWNVSNVMDMSFLFANSQFNGDISQWNVKRLGRIDGIFHHSQFKGDLSNWKPYSIWGDVSDEFINSPTPYWAHYINIEDKEAAINIYHLKKEFNNEITSNNSKNITSKNKLKL